MNKKLEAVESAGLVPKSAWFIAGALSMIALFLYHAFVS